MGVLRLAWEQRAVLCITLYAALMAAWPAAPAFAQGRVVAAAGVARGAEPDAVPVLDRLTRQPVRLVSTGRPLAEVQGQLETALGVRLILTAGAAAVPIKGEVAAEDGLSFLREPAATLRLEWALGRDGVYLAPEGSHRAVVFTAPSSVVAFRAAALANQEFEGMGSGIRVVGRKEEITVTGIPVWINQVAALRVPLLVDFVQRTMNQYAGRKAEGEAEAIRNNPLINLPGTGRSGGGEPLSMMVFRLNNAYVDDKTVRVGLNSVTIQGVASLFQQFTGLGGGSSSTQASIGYSGDMRVPRVDQLAGGRAGGLVDRAERRADRVDDALRQSQQPAAGANDPVVIADSRMNALIVRDRASMLESYKALVKVLDQPTDMVQLDAFVIDIKASRLDEFGLGLSWGGSAKVTSPALLPGGVEPVGANVILQATQGAQLLARIRALESSGDSEILTVPSVVTLNNLEASFSARESFYVKVQGYQDASLNKVTVETVLRVTPLVSQAGTQGGNTMANGNDRRIRLLINIQDGSVDDSPSFVVDSLPRTLENQISTQAVVRGGDTLVIGGQVVRKRVKKVAGLPFIKDIPLLGALTSSRVDNTEQYVRIYVVRPRILGDDSSLLNEPVAADRADPMVNGAVGRVPELIRGSGLSPQGSDAARSPNVREPSEAMTVVPVPRPLMSPPTVNGNGTLDSPDRGSKSSADEVLNDDWNPNDPTWRPPGSPLGRQLTPGPASGSSARVDRSTQASRDREARQILEAELKRAEQQVTRLETEPGQDNAAARASLSRAQADVKALRSEIARLPPSPLATAAPIAPASLSTSQSPASAVSPGR